LPAHGMHHLLASEPARPGDWQWGGHQCSACGVAAFPEPVEWWPSLCHIPWPVSVSVEVVLPEPVPQTTCVYGGYIASTI